MRIQQKPIIHGRDHLPGGPDPIPGLPSPLGNDFGGILMGHSPVGFWKLNETSGTTAHDSSGNGNDMEPTVGFGPPVWGSDENPLGETSAFFDDTGSEDFREQVTLSAAQTNNFTAGIWANMRSGEANPAELIGQGTALHGNAGWALMMQLGGGVDIAVVIDGNTVESNAPPSADTWYFIVTVRDAGTWKLYVNGLLQTDTDTTNPLGGSTDTWIGNDAEPGHSTYAQDTLMAYGFIIGSVLSGVEIMELYESGTLGGVTEGLVWTALGDGTADWRAPTIEVEF